jgi:large subunit ribosomal protein L9
MRIILTQNVPNLGFMGDEVSVKDGYARNFLLPRGMAMPASGHNARAIQHRRQHLEKQRAEVIAAARGEADKVAGLELVVKVRAGTGGRLFGSVTNRDLQVLLAERGYALDRKAILLKTPVKTLGTFSATVRLHTDVKVDLEFRVEPSEIVAASPEGEGAAPAEGAEATAGETPPEAAATAAGTPEISAAATEDSGAKA